MRLKLGAGVPLAAALMLLAPSAAQASFMHTVMPGETLTSIAATDGLTIDQLAAANGISPTTKLVIGSVLAIPPKGAPATTSTTASPTTTSSTATSSAACDSDNDGDNDCSATTTSTTSTTTTTTATTGSYVVQAGDTLSAIAARAGTTVSALASLNGLNPSHFLLSGTVLRLPGGSVTPTSVSSSQPLGSAAVGNLKSPPYPTPEHVTATQVGSIAAQNGVPPSLAAAIGWQESGFNNDVVSPVGARGVMQILPGTWNWIGSTLNRGGVPLAPASATDNVRGGVLMLHALLGATGGNQALAAAGYYQGLSSVQQHGMYSSTKQYVRDVLALEQHFGGG
jgi:LysM repeat protein